MRLSILFGFIVMVLGVSCKSDSSREVEPKSEELPEEAPRLTFELIQDSLTKKWDIAYQWKDQEDVIHTDVSVQYTLLDTVNVDGEGFPEIIIARDSLFANSGYNQRGMWHYSETHHILDIWSLDESKLLCSLVKGVRSEYNDDWQLPLLEKTEEPSENTRIKSYQYDIEFKFGSIEIKNLKQKGYMRVEPAYVEGEYVCNEGVLEMIGTDSD